MHGSQRFDNYTAGLFIPRIIEYLNYLGGLFISEIIERLEYCSCASIELITIWPIEIASQEEVNCNTPIQVCIWSKE